MICFTHLTVTAQNRAVDSLENVLMKLKDDTLKLRLYIKLCDVSEIKDYNKYTEPALKLAEKLLLNTKDENERKMILIQMAKSYHYIIHYYEEKMDESTALLYYQKILSIYREMGDEEGILGTMLAISFILKNQGNIIKAMDYVQNGLSIARKTGNKKGIANCLKALAEFYNDQGDEAQALVNYQKCLSTFRELKDTFAMASIYICMGDAYSNLRSISKAIDCDKQAEALYEQAKSPEGLRSVYNWIGLIYAGDMDFENALINLQKGLSIAEKLPNKSFVRGILDNIGDVYRQKGDVNKALEYHNRALVVAKETQIENQVAWVFNSLSKDYQAQKNYRKAKEYSGRYLAIIRKYDYFTIYLREGEYLASQIDSTLGNFREAYGHYQQYILLTNKLNSEEVRKAAIKDKFQSDYDQQKAKDKVEQEKKDILHKSELQQEKIIRNSIIGSALLLLLVIGVLINRYRFKQRANKKLETAYKNLESAQEQLVQQEKLASLGALTAGIAHEIKNPLNFVNNFAELSTELLGELKTAASEEEKKEIMETLKQNLEKINQHGKRADGIVKSMLEHSRSGTGEKQPTDINKLCDEYLNLAYHGMRASVKDFNCTLERHFAENLPKLNIVPQEISRVLLNLINNAFYAIKDKPGAILTLTTLARANSVIIKIKDNGTGIPEDVKQKIFEPFFTTKPAGSGTGLGLSLSFDIIKAYGGKIEVQSEEGKGTEFIISLPV
jgi:two-component system, NtrC family, sensor kinase